MNQWCISSVLFRAHILKVLTFTFCLATLILNCKGRDGPKLDQHLSIGVTKRNHKGRGGSVFHILSQVKLKVTITVTIKNCFRIKSEIESLRQLMSGEGKPLKRVFFGLQEKRSIFSLQSQL